MPEVKNNFVPIDQINSERLRVSLKLPPFIPAHQLGINVDRIIWLCDIAGIDHLRVESVNQGTSGFLPVVVGMTEQGSAIAGKIGLKTEVKTYSSDADQLDNEIEDRDFTLRQTNAKVSLNIDEVTSQIQEDQTITKGLRSPDPWSNILDQSIKQCLIKEGTNHLLLGLNKREWIGAALFWAYIGLSSADLDPYSIFLVHRSPHIPTLLQFGLQFLVSRNTVNCFNYFENRFMGNSKYRFSLFYVPQYDRALIINTLGRAGKIAKTLPE